MKSSCNETDAGLEQAARQQAGCSKFPMLVYKLDYSIIIFMLSLLYLTESYSFIFFL